MWDLTESCLLMLELWMDGVVVLLVGGLTVGEIRVGCRENGFVSATVGQFCYMGYLCRLLQGMFGRSGYVEGWDVL